MKRKKASAAAAEFDADEPSQAPLPLEAFSGDVCAALTARYGRSTAPQHRHLLASAAAIRSILVDDGLPVTPASYLSPAVSALQAAGPADPAAASALASLLAILLPHIPSSSSSLPPASASESATALAALLSSPDASQLPTGTVRSVVKSLGYLALHVDAAADWDAVAAPLGALLAASVDQRAKVRRCAQESAEKLFAYLKHCGCGKKASNAAIGMFEKHILSAKSHVNLNSDASEGKEVEAANMIGAMAVLVPFLSKKAMEMVFSEIYELLSPCFSPLTRHVLKLMETLLDHLKAENVESELANLIPLLLAYLHYDEKKPDDTIVAALQLMRNCLVKLVGRPTLWMEALPSAFEAVSGYLILDRKCSEDIARLLQDCINSHIDRNIILTGSQLCDHDYESLNDGAAVKSICLSINNMLCASASPPDSILTIVLVLFLKLGEHSYVFMKHIILTLSQIAIKIGKGSQRNNVEECIGAAVISVGPDKILSLIPIAFDVDRLTCSNTWLLPILDKYIYGASLQQFLECIVPLAESVQKASSRVKIARKCEDLQSLTDQLWNLLPAFCHFPVDVCQNFGSLSKLLLEMLKCDRYLYKPAVKALQQLVDGTRRLSSSDKYGDMSVELSALFSSKIINFSCSNLEGCSKKDARKNMKVLASHSVDLLCTITEYFLDSSPEKRVHLKEALRCLAQLSGSTSISNLFLSLVKRLGLEDTHLEQENLECQANEVDKKDEGSTDVAEEKNKKRSLLMELISTFAETADEDLLDLLFGFVKSSLLNNKPCESKALFALSIILKEHNVYSLARLDEIMMLLHGIKTHLDNGVLEGQLLCYQYLLVHMIKVNEENTSKKAFLILNELIVALKSKKESRRLAYDVLLAISNSLRSSESNSEDSDIQRLFTMVMGYLSSPSPHIVSGAIAALSLLIYNDADFCMEVPNLIPSVLVFLQHKAIEVTKASLGFVKVLVTSLQSEKLLNLQADIMSGILKWSSVTKHHFKGKVVLILEILIRKCGFDAVNLITPEKYKAFVRSVEEGRKGNNNPAPADRAESDAQPTQHTAKRLAYTNFAFPLIIYKLIVCYFIWYIYRRKRFDSNVETRQEERPTQAPFFIKGAGRARPPGAKFQQTKASGRRGDRTNFKSKSEARPGNSQSTKGDKSQGYKKRTRSDKFDKTQNHGGKASARTSRFKKPRTAAAT
ncbi:hypothetical protein GUJ93_ZPchr0001g33139 [Zizania palustris]|uniref:Ribosomal RNA-processing protein 12-like conserved domain-containing protein n=1 Tax=Zizania palustris TaxID=103762 RepID=A0A8J5VBE7_ZIZPA|nr:hypothetical protein GUJ93_ZPchr0001g33139 [Zizania palustris]